MSLEVDSGDVIRLVLQFLKENNLNRTLSVLQEESQISLNTVESAEAFQQDILRGNWDAVLQACATLKLSMSSLFELYEHIVMEMMELREVDTARAIMRMTTTMNLMKQEQPERYLALEHMLTRSQFDPTDLFPEGKEKKREKIAQTILSEVSVVPPSRLLSIINQALKWQRYQGLIQPGSSFDVFRGVIPDRLQHEEKPPTQVAHTVKFGKKSHAECASFSPDGHFLVSGSVDGFLEVWDPMTGKLRKDLDYQNAGDYMMHEQAVLCMGWSMDSEQVATGSQDGKIFVWKVQNGQVIKRFENAHNAGVACLNFSRDGSQILSGGFDSAIRIHGLKSGRTLREFRGHSSFVTDCFFSVDGTKIVSGSSDGTVKIWDAKTTECLTTVKPPQPNASSELTINSVTLLPRTQEQLVICNRSNTIHVMNFQGQIVKSFTTGMKESGDFVCCCVSPKGDFLYAIAEDNFLYAFNVKTGHVEVTYKTHEKEVNGISHHPHKNIVITYSDDGTLRIWR
eukprot:TRINITY_DN3081_c0_g2_i1.p1 TRINITY_DN3081_c0_g2~~TRINITY_DN3081_c0_g2_i1.p1  ORF type:complete len:511 (+),score=109.74 TRINITY_DN3081_c0_g2_i1:69-1601(+)